MSDDGRDLAVGAMIGWCGWNPTAYTTETILLDGEGTRLLQLPSLHVTDVSEVRVALRDGTFDAPLQIGPYGMVTWSDNGILELPLNCAWPQGRRNVSVSYSGGYQNVPADLDAALRSLGKRLVGPAAGATYRRMGSAGFGFGQRVAEGDLLVTEQLVFDRYRIPRVR